MEITAIIPARYDSTRFPGKPLANIAGEPMIKHVYQRVEDVKNLDKVIVATDDKRIYDTVESFGGRVEMTSKEHSSGTDRIAEVASSLESDLIINVQGDEPLIEPAMIEQAVDPFYCDDGLVMSTLKKKIESKSEVSDPNVVKVVTDREGYALYFSRSTIPYSQKQANDYYKHIGLYVYSKDFLLQFSNMKPTSLEKTESLEQLRALQNGYKIKVVETNFNTIGVDRPDDIERVEEIISTGNRIKK